MKICLWCGEPVHLEPGKGWVHPDGNLRKQRFLTAGEVQKFEQHANRSIRAVECFIDDHLAAPVEEMEFAI